MSRRHKEISFSERQMKTQVRIERIREISKIITTSLKYIIIMVCICYIAYIFSSFLYLSIKELSGKTTSANILVKFLSAFKISFFLSIAFGGGSLLYASRERKLRKEYIKKMSKRIDYLEKQLNPNKKSSNITETGETREVDK